MSNFWTSCYSRSQKFSLPWFYFRRSGCQTSRESLKKMALQCATALIISVLVIPVKTPPWLTFSLHLFELRLLTKKKMYNVRKENLRLFERLLYHVYGMTFKRHINLLVWAINRSIYQKRLIRGMRLPIIKDNKQKPKTNKKKR